MRKLWWIIVCCQWSNLVDAGGLRRGQSTLSNEDSLELQDILKLSPSLADGQKRPVLTVELMGGLGNQLFQVAALVSTGLRLSPTFSVALPDVTGVCCNRSTYWHSVFRKLRPLLLQGIQQPAPLKGSNASRPTPGKCLVEQVPGFDPYDDDCSDATAYNASWASALASRASCGTVRLYGYFQHPAFFQDHLPMLRQAFWDEASATEARKRLNAALPGAGHERPVVSVHYRLGDYDANGWVLDSDYYDAALLQVAHHLAPRKPRCLIFSDEPQRASSRSSTLQGCAEIVLANASDAATSFHMMSLAQASVTADSTFSYWAALLGNKKEVIVTPQIQGPKKACWSYLQHAPSLPADTSWIQVPATTLSSQQLFAQEVLEMASPPDD